MDLLSQVIVTIICTLVASSGFWAFVDRNTNRKSAERDLLIGLAHDRIMSLGIEYIKRGWISQEEYENFFKYLYKPYESSGGNGSAKRIMQEVDKLPIHDVYYAPRTEEDHGV